MKTVCIVSGNKGKLAEWKRLMPATFKMESAPINLEEIQSLDSQAIVKDKAERAYEILKKPVIVEDVSVALKCLNGLPGPFIKFFEETLGNGALYELARHYDDNSAVVKCNVAYYDGKHFLFAEGTVKGQAVPNRGDHGFGFDTAFLPNSYDQTFGEMDFETKDKISHRSQAVRSLAEQLKDLTD